MKVRPVGAELFHADGRTDMPKLTVAFFATSRTRPKLLGIVLEFCSICKKKYEYFLVGLEARKLLNPSTVFIVKRQSHVVNRVTNKPTATET